MIQVGEGDYICGPLKCLQALRSGFKNIAKHPVTFGLEKADLEKLKRQEVLSASRAGLNPSKHPDMYNKMYRYFIYPMKKHESKGEIIASLRGSVPDEKLKEIFCWRTLHEEK